MALVNEDNSRRAYLQRDYLQSRTTGAVTWFINERAITTPRPEREKGEQCSENRAPWIKKASVVNLSSRKGTKGMHIPTVLSPLGPWNCWQGSHCQNPTERKPEDKEALDVVPRARGWGGKGAEGNEEKRG